MTPSARGGGGEVGEKKEKIVVLSFSFSRACFALVLVEKKKRKTSAYRIMLRPLFSCYFVARYGKVCKTNCSFCSYKRESFAFTQDINLYVSIATFFQLP